MRTTMTILVLVSLNITAASAAPIDALNNYVGTWSGSGTSVVTPFGPAGTLRGTSVCSWTTDHLFVVCQQSHTYNNRADTDLTIFTYDDAGKQYHFYRITPGDANATELTYSANAFTFHSHFKNDAGATVYLRTLNTFVDSQRYAWRTEYSSDQVHWSLMNSGSVVRAK